MRQGAIIRGQGLSIVVKHPESGAGPVVVLLHADLAAALHSSLSRGSPFRQLRRWWIGAGRSSDTRQISHPGSDRGEGRARGEEGSGVRQRTSASRRLRKWWPQATRQVPASRASRAARDALEGENGRLTREALWRRRDSADGQGGAALFALEQAGDEQRRDRVASVGIGGGRRGGVLEADCCETRHIPSKAQQAAAVAALRADAPDRRKAFATSKGGRAPLVKRREGINAAGATAGTQTASALSPPSDARRPRQAQKKPTSPRPRSTLSPLRPTFDFPSAHLPADLALALTAGMDAFANPSATPASALNTAQASTSAGGTRQRIITSCLTCRRRKVKCDHKYPVCSACSRGNHVCYYANIPNHHQQDSRSPPSAQSSANRVHKHSSSQGKGQSSHSEINARLERLESLLELAVHNQPPSKLQVSTAKQQPQSHAHQVTRRDTSQSDVSEAKERVNSSASPNSSTSGDIQAADAYDGTLLVENGQSHFVSSLHWALLTEELQDIKAILSTEGKPGQPQDPTAWGGIRTSQSLLFSSGQAAGDTSVFMPETQEECFELFSSFIHNVDPVSRLVHKPSLNRRFAAFIRRWQNLTPSSASGRSGENFDDHWNEEQLQNFEPLAYAIFYSALNSLKPEIILARFRKDKLSLLRKYQQGLEFSLQQADFLTTSSIEVLQAFILYLTVQAREDDMGQVWPLTGVAIRIAMLQGLHREPSFFTSSMDEVQVEIRRRMWHQICHLDWRASEGKGMEPTISDDDFTTLLPRNVSDSDLVEGRPPPSNPYLEEEGVTDMALQLCRLSMIQCFRKIAQNAYRLDRKCKDSRIRNNNLDIVPELQALFEETKQMVDEVHTKNERCILRYCRLDVTVERMTIGLSANLEWRCWLIFWSGVPKDLRQVVINNDVRTMILTRSVSLIESLNRVSDDKEAEQFQWHIGGHAAFQAIMHILAELRDPEFNGSKDPIIRSRALRALHTVLGLKGRSESNTWAVIKRMIDRLDPNHEHAKPEPGSGISKERFGEDELSVMYFAKSPSPATSQNVSRPASTKSPPQASTQARVLSPTQGQMPPPTTTPSAVSQQDYAFFPPAQVAMPRSDLNSSIDARYQSVGQGMAGTLSDIERRNAGLSEANTNDWLQDMAMDMDWGFWNFDPLQFDAGFGQFAGPEGSGQ